MYVKKEYVKTRLSGPELRLKEVNKRRLREKLIFNMPLRDKCLS